LFSACHTAARRGCCQLPLQVLACSYSYVFTLTIPNSALTYWAFPKAVATFGNALAMYPPSALRTTAIILMTGHSSCWCVRWESGTRTQDLKTERQPAATLDMHLRHCAAQEALLVASQQGSFSSAAAS
jgi:hypothetical protein